MPSLFSRKKTPDAPTEIAFSATLDIEAANATAGKRPTFSIVAYRGGEMQLNGFAYPLVVDLEGVTLAASRIPILVDHDHSRIVGQSDDVRIDATGIYISGKITGDDEDSKSVVAHAKNGFEWQASIGAKATKTTFVRDSETKTVNGRTITGPCYVADATILAETSFVAIGADNTTTADIAATHKGFEMPGQIQTTNGQTDVVTAERQRVDGIHRIVAKYRINGPVTLEDGNRVNDLAEHAIEANMDVRDVELAAIRAARPQATHTPVHHNYRPTGDRQILECGLALRAGVSGEFLTGVYGQQSVEAADRSARRYSLVDVATQCIVAGGGYVGNESPMEIIATASSTYSLPGLLSNVARRALESAYRETPSTWTSFAGTRNVRDFRQVDTYRPNWELELKQVGKNGDIQHGTVGEESLSYKIDQYARMFSVSRIDIINDDLGFLDTLPREMARAAKRTLDNLVYRTLLANVDFEGNAFYASGNNNLLEAGSDLDIESLGLALATMRKRTDANGDSIDLVPKVLLVPPSLESTALVVLKSAELEVTSGGTFNPVQNRVSLVVEPRLENTNLHANASGTAWYLMAGPVDAPVIVAFLDGQKVPRVESEEHEFKNLGMQFRVVHDFGVALGDPRATIKATGAAS